MKYVYPLLLVYLLGTLAQAQTSRYVSTTGSTAPSGAISWATSTTDLQGAISAVASGGGGYVYIAQGVYKPGGTSNTNRSISFSMANSVTIVGGYVGSGSPGASVPLSSTLSGEIGNPASTTDNSYHVIKNPASLSLNASAVLADVVITGGNANLNSYPENLGGGMYNNGDRFVCSPTLRNCLFFNNRASTGGGMTNDARENGESKPTLVNCSFVDNVADFYAGGIFNVAQSGGNCSPEFVDCSFTGNRARFGAGIYNDVLGGTSTPVLRNCRFADNQSLQTGGALYNSSNSGECSPALFNCTFLNNRSQSGFAGAIVNDGRSGVCRSVLTNCSIRGNSASQQGAAMYNSGSIVTLVNCVLWDNGGSSIINSNAVVLASYSLFQNDVSGYSGVGNIRTEENPFLNSTDVQLKSCSRAINAGNPASVTVISAPYSSTNLPATDLGGNARIIGGLVDIGAYEFQGVPDTPTAFTQQPLSGSVSCLNSSVSIPVSVSGVAPYYYQWYKDGVALTTVESATTGTLTLTNLAITDGGSYSVIANGGCGSARSSVFSLTVTPRATLAVSNSGVLTCTVPTVTLTAGGGVSYSFARIDDGVGLVSQNTVSGNAVVNESGTYSVTVTDSYGCRAPLSTTITSNTAIPALSLTSSGTLTCTNRGVTLTASPTGSYTYTFGGGAVQIGSGNTATVSVGSVYSVVVRSSDGCTAVASTTVLADTTTPALTLSATNNGVITCNQPTLTLTASDPLGVGGLIYAFIGPGVNQSGTQATVPVSMSGGYSVTATGANGCTATSSTFVSQNTTPPIVSISPVSATLSCAMPTVSLTAQGGTSYRWDDGSTLVPTRVISASGVYSVTATGVNGCTGVASVLVSSKPGEDVAFIGQIASGSAVCPGSIVTISVSATGTGISYQWYHNGLLMANQTSATLTLTSQTADAGEYKVEASGRCGSVTSSIFVLTVKPSPAITIGFIPETAPAVWLQASGGVYYRIIQVIANIASYQIRRTDENSSGRFIAQKGQAYTLIATGANGCETIIHGRVPN